jgi:hypothetical protein
VHSVRLRAALSSEVLGSGCFASWSGRECIECAVFRWQVQVRLDRRASLARIGAQAPGCDIYRDREVAGRAQADKGPAPSGRCARRLCNVAARLHTCTIRILLRPTSFLQWSGRRKLGRALGAGRAAGKRAGNGPCYQVQIESARSASAGGRKKLARRRRRASWPRAPPPRGDGQRARSGRGP